MALSTVGQVTGCEILFPVKGGWKVELDSGEFGILPAGKLKRDRNSDPRDGSELRVLVIGTREGGDGKPFHTVSERLDEVIDVEEEGAAPSATPDSALVIKFPVGKRVKGSVAHVHGDAVIVILDGHRARLPVSEMNGMKTTSLRPGVAVKAAVLRVDGTGVVLSRKVVG